MIMFALSPDGRIAMRCGLVERRARNHIATSRCERSQYEDIQRFGLLGPDTRQRFRWSSDTSATTRQTAVVVYSPNLLSVLCSFVPKPPSNSPSRKLADWMCFRRKPDIQETINRHRMVLRPPGHSASALRLILKVMRESYLMRKGRGGNARSKYSTSEVGFSRGARRRLLCPTNCLLDLWQGVRGWIRGLLLQRCQGKGKDWLHKGNP